MLSSGAPEGGAVDLADEQQSGGRERAGDGDGAREQFHGSFTIATATVSATTVVTITASYNGTTRTGNLTVNPPGSSSSTLTNLVVSPATVSGGSSAQGAVVLAAAATTATSVALSSSNAGVAAVPASVTVPAGSQSAVFAISTSGRDVIHDRDDQRRR